MALLQWFVSHGIIEDFADEAIFSRRNCFRFFLALRFFFTHGVWIWIPNIEISMVWVEISTVGVEVSRLGVETSTPG